MATKNKFIYFQFQQNEQHEKNIFKRMLLQFKLFLITLFKTDCTICLTMFLI